MAEMGAIAVLCCVTISVIALAVVWLMLPALKSESSPDHPQEDEYTDEQGVLRKFPKLLGSGEEAPYYLTLVVPAYNEEVRLPIMLDETLKYLSKRQCEDSLFKWEMIIVDDGSSDKTCEVVRDFMKKSRAPIKLCKLFRNHGKGGAVKKGMMRAAGKLILFLDADGATNIEDFDKLEDQLGMKPSTGDKAGVLKAVAVGSRVHLEKESIAQRSMLRTILMHGFHQVARICVRSVQDTQCGFKLFTRASAKSVIPSLHIERWAFDIEIIYLCESLDIEIQEVAVRWQEIDGSKVNPLTAAITMARDILAIRLCYLFGIWKVNAAAAKGKKKRL